MNVAIIAAAGTGSRMAGDRPKQFLQLAGVPIIFHTLKPFEQCDSIQEIIVVLPAAESADFLALVPKYGVTKLSRVVPGGKTRAESVWRGLLAIRGATAEVVAVHERGQLCHALTPQCFRYELLRRAYERADVHDPAITDDSSLVEQLGEPVTIVEGSSRNIKITTQRDLLIAEAFLKAGTD